MKKKRTGSAIEHNRLRLLCARLAAAAIYMQPKFGETRLFREFAESEAGELLHGKLASVDRALDAVHAELLRAGLVALTDAAREAITKDGKSVVKKALKAYLEGVESSVPEDMRGDVLARHEQYQQARKLYESMS